MLTSAELTFMRSAVADLLPDTCNILSLTKTSDGAGGWSEAWGTITGGTAVACRVDYRTGKEAVTGGALLPYQSAIISMPYSVTVTTNNRIEVGANVFEIKAVNAGQSWKAISRLDAELL